LNDINHDLKEEW